MDPKYQNLPYIAVGEPDIYETGELPEADQAFNDYQEDDGSVERLLVDPKEAFSKFNKTNVDSSSTNFSGGQPGRAGYSVHYEVLPEHERGDETLMQRVQRLKCELKEIEDLSKTSFESTQGDPVTIMNEVRALQQQIDSFAFPSVASQEQSSLAYSQLLTQLKATPATKSSPKKAAPGQSAPADATLFELSYKADPAQASKEASLEKRITLLEEIIGDRSATSKVLCENVGSQTVMDAVASLASKVTLLDEDKVDKLSARLQILHQSLNKLAESDAGETGRDMEKINELYELVKKWDSCSDALPTIVDRLYTLQELHQHAMEFSANLKALEAAQAELSQSIANHSGLLTDVQKTFATNVDTIKSNVENLEKRMTALKK